MSSDDWQIEFFSQLYEDLTEHPVDLDAVRGSLEERGIDVAATITAGLESIANHKRRMRLLAARQKLDRLRRIVEEWTTQGKGDLAAARDDIARALAGATTGTAYQAYHRKLKDVRAEDLESLSEDAALLEFLAEIETDDVDP